MTTRSPSGLAAMATRRSLLLAGLATPALAQQPWPSRPIRMIVPFTPGGSTDAMARIGAQKLQEALGQTVVVENRAGANGAVGGIAVAQAAPDGYTLCSSASIQVMARWVMKEPGYDPLRDLTPVARMGQGPLLLVMHKELAPRSITELVAAAKANPRGWTFATSSLGSAGHLATIEFNRLTGLDIPIASYRGTSPALQDVVAGNVQLMIDPILATGPAVRQGTVRALAITAPRRSPAAPEVPSAPEAGLPGMDFFSWWAVWGPRGLPPEIIARVNGALRAAMREADTVQRLTALGIEPVTETPEEFAAFIERDVARNAELLKLANFQPD